MKRLLIVSNRAPFCTAVGRVVRVSTVCVVSYDFQTATLQDIVQLIRDGLGGQLVDSIALLLHCDYSCFFICYKENKVLDTETVQEDLNIKNFLKELASNLVKDSEGIHIFNSPQNINPVVFTGRMSNLLKCSVELVTDLFGPISQQIITEKYFFISELKTILQTRGMLYSKNI